MLLVKFLFLNCVMILVPNLRHSFHDTTSLFADGFSKAFCGEPDGTLCQLPRSLPSLYDMTFHPRIVDNELKQLKASISSGIDGLSAKLLKPCSSGLSYPLSVIMQSLLTK